MCIVYQLSSACKNLMLDTGGLVTVESATLPVATYSKFQPLSKVYLKFLNASAIHTDSSQPELLILIDSI